MVKFDNDWDILLADEFQKPYYLQLHQFLKEEYSNHLVFPLMNNLFNALKYTSYKDTKVVIIGQDPYFNPNQAHGLAFSVMPGQPVPPSLKNIFKEIATDVGVVNGESGCLVSWAKQGVLMLNAVLSVRAYEPGSHRNKGWEKFTDKVIEHLNNREDPVIFILWGNDAKAKRILITNPRHYILSAAHPSPQSAYSGFFGCRHFSKVNDILTGINKTPIDWKINN
jgi:uracil-DNA glycosylase